MNPDDAAMYSSETSAIPTIIRGATMQKKSYTGVGPISRIWNVSKFVTYSGGGCIIKRRSLLLLRLKEHMMKKVQSGCVTSVARTEPVVHRSASRVYSGVDG